MRRILFCIVISVQCFMHTSATLLDDANKQELCDSVALAVKYFKGDSVEQNYERAFHLFDYASSKGHMGAMCGMAIMYQRGLGHDINYERAYLLYKKTADRGFAPGCYGAGYLLYKGLGVEQNYDKALYYLKKGAKQNNAGCLILLSSHYLSGIGGVKDNEKAKQYMKQAFLAMSNAPKNEKREFLDVVISGTKKRKHWKKHRRNEHTTKAMPELSNNVSLTSIGGLWTGIAYQYDWSHTRITDEQEVTINVVNSSDSTLIQYYVTDSLYMQWNLMDKGNDYVTIKNDTAYSWIPLKTLLEKKSDVLLMELRCFDNRKNEYTRPMLLVLHKQNKKADINTSFRIDGVSLRQNKLCIIVDTDIEQDIEIMVTPVLGVSRTKTIYNKQLAKGHNNIEINPLYLKRGTYIVTVAHKNERHSKTVTVRGDE